MQRIERSANLFHFPDKKMDYAPQVIIGDLHGNAWKFIYILLEEGILELSELDYKRFINIYYGELTKESIQEFKEIFDRAKINNVSTLTLLGDELADRGENDFFNLWIEKKLHENLGNNVDIQLSNHNWEFIRLFLITTFKMDLPRNEKVLSICKEQISSYLGMQKLIKQNVINKYEVLNILHDCVIPHINIFSFSITKDGVFNLFSHAPCGLETIQLFCQGFDLAYNDQTMETLAITIIELNKYFRELLLDVEGFKYLNKLYVTDPKKLNDKESVVSRALHTVLWNRGESRLLPFKNIVIQTAGGFKVNPIFGHIGQTDHPNNLDNDFGKIVSYTQTGKEIKHYTGHSSAYIQHQLIDSQAYEVKNDTIIYFIQQKAIKDLVFSLKKILKGINKEYANNNEIYWQLKSQAEMLELVFSTNVVNIFSIPHQGDFAEKFNQLFDTLQPFFDKLITHLKPATFFKNSIFKSKLNMLNEELILFKNKWLTMFAEIKNQFAIVKKHKIQVSMYDRLHDVNYLYLKLEAQHVNLQASILILYQSLKQNIDSLFAFGMSNFTAFSLNTLSQLSDHLIAKVDSEFKLIKKDSNSEVLKEAFFDFASGWKALITKELIENFPEEDKSKNEIKLNV